MRKLILMLLISLILIGCAVQKQNVFEVTANNGLPVLIDTNQLTSIIINGTDCLAFLKSGVQIGVRNCDQLKNEWKKTNR